MTPRPIDLGIISDSTDEDGPGFGRVLLRFIVLLLVIAGVLAYVYQLTR